MELEIDPNILSISDLYLNVQIIATMEILRIRHPAIILICSDLCPRVIIQKMIPITCLAILAPMTITVQAHTQQKTRYYHLHRPCTFQQHNIGGIFV